MKELINYKNGECLRRKDIEILIRRAPKDALLKILEDYSEVKLWKLNELTKIKDLKEYANIILKNTTIIGD